MLLNNKAVNEDKPAMVDGILDVKLLPLSDNECSPVSAPMEVGMTPVIDVDAILSVCRLINWAMDSGIGPISGKVVRLRLVSL